MAVGKHRFKLYTEIVSEDPAYCVWVIGERASDPKRGHRVVEQHRRAL